MPPGWDLVSSGGNVRGRILAFGLLTLRLVGCVWAPVQASASGWRSGVGGASGYALQSRP